jgi:hypothetical protein
MAFRVRLADEPETPEILALLAEHLPEADPAARFRWLYLANPGGRALTWLARDEASGAVAGLTSLFPFRLWEGGREVLGALGGDGYVRPAFRRRGLGGMLHDASRRAMPERRIACMYGAPGPMNVTPLKKGGSREIGAVARWSRPLGAAGLGRLAAAPVIVDRALALALRPRLTGARLVPAGRADARVDEVWVAARGALRLAAVRDAAFYAWRFLDAPAARQRPYVVVRRGRPIAACALERLARGVRIVDLIAAPDAWRTALRTIAAHAADAGAELVDIKLLAPDGRRRRLWRYGFVERESKPYLVMVPDGDDASPMLDPERWFYTGADSDLDFLE